MQHPRSRDGLALVQEKHHSLPAPDESQLEHAFIVYGAVQVRQHGVGAILRMTGNADCVPAQAFDPVVAALGLHIDRGTARQALAVYEFSGCHSKLPVYRMRSASL